MGAHEGGQSPAESVVLHVQLRPGVDTPTADVEAAVEESGSHLVPEFPGASDPELACHWRAAVPRARVDELQRRLLDMSAVDGAWTKPSEEPA